VPSSVRDGEREGARGKEMRDRGRPGEGKKERKKKSELACTRRKEDGANDRANEGEGERIAIPMPTY